MRSILLDAGPQIVLFAVDDRHHQHYDKLIAELSATGLRLLTTWPCIVEASYLLDVPQRYELLQWVGLGGIYRPVCSTNASTPSIDVIGN
ncbi:MAG: hypothetical protein R3F37_04470 [Candidatus Competibacteraceae bacterium]